jgi:hypothetical protein
MRQLYREWSSQWFSEIENNEWTGDIYIWQLLGWELIKLAKIIGNRIAE